MKRAARIRIGAAAALVSIALAGVLLTTNPDNAHSEGQDMTPLTVNEWATTYEPFPEDIAEIERLWSQALPTDVSFIGGLDWPAWGAFARHAGDPPGIVRGSARDRSHFYEGPYRAESGTFDISGGIDFAAFEISGLDGERVVLHRRNQPPPVDYFYLVPVDTDQVRQAPTD